MKTQIEIQCMLCGKPAKKPIDQVNAAHHRGYKMYCGRSCSGSAHRRDRVCTLEGCGLKAIARGFCSKHYARFVNNGSPETLRKNSPGVRLEWLKTHVRHSGESCLPFPFGGGGYGKVIEAGKSYTASRLMCILAHGHPPTKTHQAAHKCGNGHLRCVNPEHLYWATPSQNAFDRVKHGTSNRGQRHGLSRFTEKQIFAIRKIISSGANQQDVADAIDCSITAIALIMSGRTWGWLQ